MVQQGFERRKLHSLWYVISHQDFKIRTTCVLLFVQVHAHTTRQLREVKLTALKIQHKQCQSVVVNAAILNLVMWGTKWAFFKTLCFKTKVPISSRYDYSPNITGQQGSSLIGFIHLETVVTDQNINTVLQKRSNNVSQELQTITCLSINKVKEQGYLRHFLECKNVLH